jgi:hypothetical protein
MPAKRFSVEPIVGKLREAEKLQGILGRAWAREGPAPVHD